MPDWSVDQKANQVQKYIVMIRMLFQKTLDTFLRHISTQGNFSPKNGQGQLIKLRAAFNVHHLLQATWENLVHGINCAQWIQVFFTMCLTALSFIEDYK